MGAKNHNTFRAKQQEQLDRFRAQIVSWYIDERLTTLIIQERLKAYELDLTVGQVNYALYRFGIKRDRNTRSENLLKALKNRTHPIRHCKQCNEEYKPTSGAQIYCVACAPSKVFCRRIKNYNVGKREFDTMLVFQDGCCGICGKNLDEITTAVDHDHASGSVRGLLCRPCNLKLAVIEDRQFTLNAQAYLVKYQKTL